MTASSEFANSTYLRMKSSETPPANRLRRLSGSRRRMCSRYLAVSPIHSLRITPPSGRTSCITRAPDVALSKTLLEAFLPESETGEAKNRTPAESQSNVGVMQDFGKPKD